MARWISGALSLGCGALALWAGWSHPLSPAVAVVLMLALGILCALQFLWWPAWLLPWLPLAGFAPWTGWLIVEEWDLAVLAAAAGGYARLAFRPLPTRAGRAPVAFLPWTFLVPWLALTAVAAWRGVVDAGGWTLDQGWWQGYREPLNALRLAKPAVAVALLWPLWRHLESRDRDRALRAWLTGMLGAAVLTATPVVVERIAFTDLLNFSSDYRATGSFWEMHVGGAGLDAALALTLPAVLTAWSMASSIPGVAAIAMASGLLFYAAIATFSRIVYLAVPFAAVVEAWLRRRGAPAEKASGGMWLTAVVASIAAGGTAWLFPVAGYRGTLAWLVCILLALLAAPRAHGLDGRLRLVALVLAALLAGLVWISPVLLPKGAYVASAVAFGVGALASLPSHWQDRAEARALAVACVPAAALALVVVADHWGGARAGERAMWLGLPVALWPWLQIPTRAAWAGDLKWQVRTSLMACAGAGLVAVFSAGAYMGERMGSISDDASGRKSHWRLVLGLLATPEQQAWGLGLGRIPARVATAGEVALTSGDYRLVDEGRGPRLLLTSGAHMQGWGELFRVGQRLRGVPGERARVSMRVKPVTPLTLHVEVCAKRLLYDNGCRIAQKAVLPTAAGETQVVELPLSPQMLWDGHWYAPRSIVFSLALDAIGGRAEIEEISLRDGEGREWLANGRFEGGMAHWFASSDRHHLPWHAKNMALHIAVEQGLVALGWLAAFLVLALWRTSFGAGARDPMAPALCAALLGVLTVGLVDSIFDMPRLAFLTLWTLMLALGASSRGPSQGMRATA